MPLTRQGQHPKLSIIIVNWNSKEYVHDCIESLVESNTQLDYEIIVVDNASYDGCDRMLRRNFPDVAFHQNTSNDGFSKANNIGYMNATGHILLFLNPDTIVGPDAIDILAKKLEDDETAGAIGCKLLNADRTIQLSCVQAFPILLNQVFDLALFRRWYVRGILRRIKRAGESEMCLVPVDVISGAFLMVKRKVFEAVGGFSGEYFMYSDDVDFCYKMKRAGYRALFLPSVEVVHYGGGSGETGRSSRSSVMLRKESRFVYFRKTRGALYARAFRVTMLAVSLVRITALSCSWFPAILIGRRNHLAAAIEKWWIVLWWSVQGGPCRDLKSPSR